MPERVAQAKKKAKEKRKKKKGETVAESVGSANNSPSFHFLRSCSYCCFPPCFLASLPLALRYRQRPAVPSEAIKPTGGAIGSIVGKVLRAAWGQRHIENLKTGKTTVGKTVGVRF